MNASVTSPDTRVMCRITMEVATHHTGGKTHTERATIVAGIDVASREPFVHVDARETDSPHAARLLASLLEVATRPRDPQQASVLHET